MVNGIPCRVKVSAPDGAITDVETFYFATFRKCKKLAQLVKKMTVLDVECSKLQRLAIIAEERVFASDEEGIDEASRLMLEANTNLLEANDKRADVMQDFVLAGLTGAGYPKEEAERLATYIDMDQLPPLIGKSRMGAGYTDFFVDASLLPAK